MKTLRLLMVFLLGLPAVALAASFDCTKSVTRVEKLVCADADLRNLDFRLAAVYQRARREGLPDSQVGVQRAWIRKRNACKDKDCVRALYEARIEELVQLTNSLPDLSEGASESPEYIVRCDTRNGILSIRESVGLGGTRSVAEAPPEGGGAEYRVRPDELTRLGGTDMQPVRRADGTREFSCRLGESAYRATIAPYIFNARVMGQCGATSPVISAEVRRNGEVLLPDQRFATCFGGFRVIHWIKFDERKRSMRVLATLDALSLPVRIEKEFEFSALPREPESAIFEAFPTGDVNVDLFVAVHRRNPDYVRDALARGAAPNARDLNGFTPLAYLWNSGHERPVPGRTAELDERASEDIARLLFAAGASGNVRNGGGTSLLEHLIVGKAPLTVLDSLLQHGADPKTDQSLARASAFGNPALVEKLLARGADPNAKGSDGRTALWLASVSAFRSYGGKSASIEEALRCVRLLQQHGAKAREAAGRPDQLLADLVGGYWRDERLRLIMAELIPHSSQAAIRKAHELSIRIGRTADGAALSAWLAQFVRP